MNNQNILDLLSAHGIRKTPFRIELLRVFTESKHGLSFADIKSIITHTQDKVTIYRGLDAFLEKGLIHKVPSNERVTKYALQLHEESHQHSHAHFICNQCENTFCIDDIRLPNVKNIEGYQVKKLKVTLEGNCPDCS